MWQYYFNNKYCNLCKFIYTFFHKYANANYTTSTVIIPVKDLGIYHKSN